MTASYDDGSETQDLIHLATRGDQAAWSCLYERHRTLLRLFIHGRIPKEFRGRFDTEEVLSSGIVAAFENLGQFNYRGADSFQRWITEILANKLRDKIRYNSCRKRDVFRDYSLTHDVSPSNERPETESPSVLLLEAEEQAKILAGLDRLSDQDQEVIGLRVLDKMSWDDIAEQLNVSKSTARRRLTDALQRLVGVVGDMAGS